MGNEVVFMLKEDPSRGKDIFTIWVTMLYPFTNTTAKESALLAALLRKRHDIAKSVTDHKLVDTILFMTEKRNEIKLELGMSDITFNNTLALLKKKKIITKDNSIFEILIPKLDDTKEQFSVTFNIELYERK